MNGDYEGNDGRFPEECPVLVRYPLTAEQNADRSRRAWPWLPGTVLEQVGPDEWQVCMDGCYVLSFPDPDRPVGADPHDPQWRLYPVCFRESSELRRVSLAEWERARALYGPAGGATP